MVLINFLIDKIHNYFKNHINLSEYDSIKLKYILEVILNELSKIIVLFLIFSFLNEQRSFIYCLISLIPLRAYTGGIHYKTYMGCLIFSGIFFLISIYLSNKFSPNYFNVMIQLVFSLLVIVLLAPITSKTRPKYSNKKILKFKFFSILIVLFHFIMYFATKNNPYFAKSIWVITLQCIQLLIAKGGLLYEKSKNDFHEANKLSW
ncbi:accessory gene regulator B family protein [Proteiniborus sp.]|uniref:accessory gene regulator ArgB-like protein n=1 Tax=Proteiniborus sp. TaxID=2079015 RepID=UPI00331CF345